MPRKVVSRAGLMIAALAMQAMLVVPPIARSQPWSFSPLPDGLADRAGHSAILDPIGRRMIVFGGAFVRDNVSIDTNDLWTFSLITNTWSVMAAAGTAPPARSLHAAIHDPDGRRMLVFGGADATVWSLSLDGDPAWSALATSGDPPSPRTGHTAIFDPLRRRMVVFGGQSGSSYLDEVWTLALDDASWTRLAPVGTPPRGRSQHVAAYDPAGDRMLVFGGDGGPGVGLLNGVFALDLAGIPAWSVIAGDTWPDPYEIPRTVPARRRGAAGFCDEAAGRLVIVGGLCDPGLYAPRTAFGDVWVMDLGPTPSWRGKVGDFERANHSLVHDRERGRAVLFGGQWIALDTSTDSTTTALSIPGDPVAARIPRIETAPAFALEGARPNPTSQDVCIAFTLPDAGPAVLEIVDIAGRMVLRETVPPSPGRHVLRLARSGALANGVYVVRLLQAGRVLARRMSVVR